MESGFDEVKIQVDSREYIWSNYFSVLDGNDSSSSSFADLYVFPSCIFPIFFSFFF